MLQYNTHRSKLPMPEYGRYVQELVEKCLTIEDREERTQFAYTIVATICNLFPQRKVSPEWRAKLWDHLAIMSDFKLDIDYPVEITRPEDLTEPPGFMPMAKHDIPLRQYGHQVCQMIDVAKNMADDDPEKPQLARLIANHMKKLMLAANPDGVDDSRICKDLAMLSGNELIVNCEHEPLLEYEVVASTQNKKKKRH